MKFSPRQKASFQSEILTWYQKNKRDLPWRKDRDPYHILISEVMLQQTQVVRVIPKYEAFLAAFPTLKHLTKASNTEVLRLWSGLGYNRRVLYLKRLAEVIVGTRSGIWPRDVETLITLPGIGKYTASAIACFAFDAQLAVIDTNIRKVLTHRFFNGNLPAERVLEDLATRLLPKERAYDWNQALMDYAASELKKEKIPVPAQSRFKGSDRYYRGKIIRLLLTQKKLPVASLLQSLEGDTTRFDEERLVRIIDGLIKDRFIEQKNGYIFLS